jgi:hypothetical protein
MGKHAESWGEKTRKHSEKFSTPQALSMLFDVGLLEEDYIQ